MNGAHKCKICGIPVHALSSCSSYMKRDETIRIYFSCLEVKNTNIIENNSREKWNQKTQKQLKSKSYLLPNPHLRHLNINKLKNIKSLLLLKNGSHSDELKSLKLKNINGAIIVNNTYAFDAVSLLIKVAYCNTTNFSNTLLQNSNTVFVKFFSKLVRN